MSCISVSSLMSTKKNVNASTIINIEKMYFFESVSTVKNLKKYYKNYPDSFNWK